MKQLKPMLLSMMTCLLFVSPAHATNSQGDFLKNIEYSGKASAEYFQPFNGDTAGDSNGFVALQPDVYFSLSKKHHVKISVEARAYQNNQDQNSLFAKEALITGEYKTWTIEYGLTTKFWGVTEFYNPVDVINQIDLTQADISDNKIPQHILSFSIFGREDILDIHLSIGFNERKFKQPELLAIDESSSQYNDGASSSNIDIAARWSTTKGPVDIGLSGFHGVNREPQLIPQTSGDQLSPSYTMMDQVGLDLQLTTESWLHKLEAIKRVTSEESFHALQLGAEYSIFGLFGSPADLGLILEYGWDERSITDNQSFYDDIFLGARISLNNTGGTGFLLSVNTKRENLFEELGLFAEGSGRLGNHWKWRLNLLSSSTSNSSSVNAIVEYYF